MDAFRIITCPMDEAQANLNTNVEEWALHMFLPTADHAKVTMVLISQRVLKQAQLANLRGN